MSCNRNPRRSVAPLNVIEAGRRRRSRNLNGNRYTPFCHIQVCAIPEQENRSARFTDETEAIVRRASIQDQLKYVPSSSIGIFSSTQTTPAVQYPTSFAEAVAMSRSGPGRGDIRNAKANAALEQSSSLPSSRTTLGNRSKKAKKWAPLDFGALESSIEGDGEPTSTASFHTVPATSVTAGTTASSILLTPTREPSFSSLQTTPQTTADSSPCSALSLGHPVQISQDPDQTPTQAAFNATFAHLAAVTPSTSPDRSLIQAEDSKSVKDKIENIMSRIDDAFDVEDWDPALATVDLDNSPEHLTVKPQPVTYTTVGSLVKSNAAPQFTAPVRIQREGACRRPPPTPIQIRGHENFLGLRGNTPQHSMGGWNAPVQSPYRPQPPPHLQPARASAGMSDGDRVILQKLGVNMPTMRSGNVTMAQKSLPMIDPFVNPSSTEVSKVFGLMKENNMDQSTLGNTAMSALDKMQTLLGLSQYPNPMQQFAKDRLAEFAATKIQVPAPTAPVTAPHQSASTSSSQQTFIPHNPITHGNAENGMQMKGQLDVDFRFPPFPPPGLAPPSMSDQILQASAFGSSYQSDLSNIQMSTSQQYHPLSGRPQPLKAGPPGQRQLTTGSNFPRLSSQPGNHGTGLPRAQPTSTLQPNSPWLAHNRQNMFTSIPTKTGKIRDTLSPADAAKYYPNGLPTDMTGSFTSYSDKTDEEKRIENLNSWWYSGVRRSNKTRTDWVGELEQREHELKTGSKAQPFPSPPLPLAGNHLSVAQVNEMSEPECAAPLLDSVFGSLLGYADRVITPTNKSLLSNFEQPAPHLVDSGPGGNDSLFGEDWGTPQKRVPRELKHRASKRNGIIS